MLLEAPLKGSRECRPELVEPFGLAIPFPSIYFQSLSIFLII
jgi:hypothetical protein